LAVLEDASRRYGVEVRLTNEIMTAHYSRVERRLYVGVGAVLASDFAEALARWTAQELAGVSAAAAPGAPNVTAWIVQGAPLTLESTGAGKIVRWLTGAFSPLTVAFRGDNTNKSEEQLKTESERQNQMRSGGSGLIRGFN
jgi:hypothetical protein